MVEASTVRVVQSNLQEATMKRDAWEAGFWRRVLKLGPRQCWPWMGVLKDGYGQLKSMDGANMYAHRASVMIHRRINVPSTLVVMHTCDNPRCVNPYHLRVGTQRENIHDMIRKGRAVVTVLTGDDHGSTKVSDVNVAAIRATWAQRHATKITQEQLAAQYGVTQAQISRIVNRKRRK